MLATRLASFGMLTVLLPAVFAQRAEHRRDSQFWESAGKLVFAREYHTATLLPDGRVLAIGGRAGESSLTADWEAGPYKEVQIYDPESRSWRMTGELQLARSRSTATLLANGQVLVTGGGSDPRKAELYDPATETWRLTGSLIARRNDHTATLLRDGRVLIVGGTDGGDSRSGVAYAVPSAEVYDPATETWSNVEPPSTPAVYHSSLLLPGGKVLTIGLRSHAAYVLNRDCTKLAQLYDPASGTWSAGHSSPAAFCLMGQGDQAQAVLLANDSVLVTGFGTAEQYDAATGEWRSIAAPRWVGSGHTLTPLANGHVLALGGHRGDFSVPDAELYDPETQTWMAAAPLTTGRAGHSASLLSDGKLLVAGGFDGSCCDSRYTLDSSDLFGVSPP